MEGNLFQIFPGPNPRKNPNKSRKISSYVQVFKLSMARIINKKLKKLLDVYGENRVISFVKYLQMYGSAVPYLKVT